MSMPTTMHEHRRSWLARVRATTRRLWARRPRLEHFVALVTLVLSIVIVIIIIVDSKRDNARGACQARVNSQFIKAIDERSTANEKDEIADKKAEDAEFLLAKSLVRRPQSAEFALQRYVDVMQVVQQSRREADHQRETHPLPDLPEETCGDDEG